MSVQSMGIVGTGLMGRGIAEAATLVGLRTTLVKCLPGDVAATRRAIAASFDKAVSRGKLDADGATWRSRGLRSPAIATRSAALNWSSSPWSRIWCPSSRSSPTSRPG